MHTFVGAELCLRELGGVVHAQRFAFSPCVGPLTVEFLVEGRQGRPPGFNRTLAAVASARAIARSARIGSGWPEGCSCGDCGEARTRSTDAIHGF